MVASECDDPEQAMEHACRYLKSVVGASGTAFIHIPKNAGTFIEAAFNLSHSEHQTAASMAACEDPLELSAVPSFAVLREPVDRAISLYDYILEYELFVDFPWVRDVGSFDAFVRYLDERSPAQTAKDRSENGCNDFFAPQVSWVQGVHGKTLVDHLLCLETLNDDWAALQAKVPSLRQFDLPSEPVRTSQKTLTARDVNATTRRLLTEILYEKDVHLWNTICNHTVPPAVGRAHSGSARVPHADTAHHDGLESVTPTMATESLQLTPANYTLDEHNFCADHHCLDEGKGLPACCTTECVSPAPGTPHFLYMHVHKTGGSSIECAWQEAAADGLVDLLGHQAGNTGFVASERPIGKCEARCAARGVQTARLLTVREPYSYWQSLYKYTWNCMFGACESMSSGLIKHDPAAGIQLDAPPSMPLREQQGVMRSFATFLEHVSQVKSYHVLSESYQVYMTCGDPCVYDELLRTESLEQDWEDLLSRYPELPQKVLPLINDDALVDEETHPWGPPPEAIYTPELRALVQQMDQAVFDLFGYPTDDAQFVAARDTA